MTMVVSWNIAIRVQAGLAHHASGGDEIAVFSADLGGNLSVLDVVHQEAQGSPQKVHVSVHTALA